MDQVARFHLAVCWAAMIISELAFSPLAVVADSGCVAHLDSVVSFLQAYVSANGRLDFPATIVTNARLEANGTEEWLAYVSGGGWCGSGGCHLFILTRRNNSFNLIGDVIVVSLPIRRLLSYSHGRPDIGVIVQGGGIIKPYEAILKYDGNKYAGNPTVPPAVVATPT